jgi:hypothetical protein
MAGYIEVIVFYQLHPYTKQHLLGQLVVWPNSQFNDVCDAIEGNGNSEISILNKAERGDKQSHFLGCQ